MSRDVEGVIVPDTSKAKQVLTQEQLAHNSPGQTVLDSINIVPGVTFTNNDAYGSSGGQLSIRGFSADRIIRHGRMVRGWIGASLLPLADAVRATLGIPSGQGAELARVEKDSPAKASGLEAKDVLLSFDGIPVGDLEALQWKVAGYEAPSTVKIVYYRDRERRESELRIEIDPQR